MIRNSILEYNYLGINCINKSSPQILNCVICRNFASGIKTRESNPFITSSIIAFNSNTGVWCDGYQKSILNTIAFTVTGTVISSIVILNWEY